MKDAIEVEPGVWSVLDGTSSYEVRVNENDVRVNGRAVAIEVTDPRSWDRRGSSGSAHGSAHVQAPMPGKVIRILVSLGDQVQQGQGLIVVEAMKMQNELKSPRDGRVSAIAAKEHETVNAGVSLITIE